MRKSKFVQVPDGLVADVELTATEFRLLVALMCHDWEDKKTKRRKGWVCPSMRRLGTMLGVTRQTVLSRLESLERKGYIVKLRGGGGRHVSNVYELKLSSYVYSIDETVKAVGETVKFDTQNCKASFTRNILNKPIKETEEAKLSDSLMSANQIALPSEALELCRQNEADRERGTQALIEIKRILQNSAEPLPLRKRQRREV